MIVNNVVGAPRRRTDFKVNGKAAHSEAPPDRPLLWVIREELKQRR
jgi:aerobic-type carbon monoxide dehydrogenase small subunit (CoxS/CutS family)